MIHLSKNVNPLVLDYLKSKHYKINLISGNQAVDKSIRSHADLYMCRLSANDDTGVYHGLESPKSPYPFDVSYNAVCIGKYFIHSLKYTAPDLLSKITDLNMVKINVKQGYTKCNMVILNDTCAITSDKGIFDTLKSEAPELDILPVSPKFVRLDGFPYGFLGGASGRVYDEIVFHGDLSKHPDFQSICDFIKSCGLKIKYFTEFPLTDIGSIIEEATP